MLFQRTPTDKARHDRNNAMQYLVFKQDRPAAYARMLAELPPEARAAVEQIVARLEAEEGGRS